MFKFHQVSIWARGDVLRAVGLALLAAFALASVLQGFRSAVNYSTDFQWSPTVLLTQGLNPYAVVLSGDYAGRILLSQFPPYLHLLYIVNLPLAYLPYTPAKLIWALINFGFAWGVIFYLRRLIGLSLLQTLTLAGLFLASTPYRNAVGNGQTSLMCLLALLIAWNLQSRKPVAAGVSLSLMLTKYSFAPPFLLWFLIRGRVKLLIVSAICLTGGWLLFSWICHENPLTTLGQPLKVATLVVSEGGGDIMTLAKSFGYERPLVGALNLSGLVGILATVLWVAVLRFKAPRLGEPEILTCLCLVSLLAIRHLAYDFVFVAPTAALAFVLPRLSQIAAFALVAYLGFGVRLLDAFGVNGRWVELASFLTLNSLIAIVLWSAREVRWRA